MTLITRNCIASGAIFCVVTAPLARFLVIIQPVHGKINENGSPADAGGALVPTARAVGCCIGGWA
jgi:hypothetical protein